MKISDNGIHLIKSFEGYHRRLPNGDCTTYLCPAHVLTIGYGCTEGIREGEVWTEAQAVQALAREIAKHETGVTRLVTVEINQNQYDALVSFSYNCGTGALAKSSILKRLNAGDYKGAARAFAAWNKGGGRVLPGLVRRRAQEAALFLQEGPIAKPDMPQAVDAPKPQRISSRKETTAQAGMTVTGILMAIWAAIMAKIQGWIADPLGALDGIQSFVAEYGWETAGVLSLVGFVGFKVVSALNRQDYEEGTYTPSGEIT